MYTYKGPAVEGVVYIIVKRIFRGIHIMTQFVKNRFANSQSLIHAWIELPFKSK